MTISSAGLMCVSMGSVEIVDEGVSVGFTIGIVLGLFLKSAGVGSGLQLVRTIKSTCAPKNRNDLRLNFISLLLQVLLSNLKEGRVNSIFLFPSRFL
jgi:hypothetical protein